MGRQNKVALALDSYEYDIITRTFSELRNDVLEEQYDSDPMEDVLLKTIDVPA